MIPSGTAGKSVDVKQRLVTRMGARQNLIERIQESLVEQKSLALLNTGRGRVNNVKSSSLFTRQPPAREKENKCPDTLVEKSNSFLNCYRYKAPVKTAMGGVKPLGDVGDEAGAERSSSARDKAEEEIPPPPVINLVQVDFENPVPSTSRGHREHYSTDSVPSKAETEETKKEKQLGARKKTTRNNKTSTPKSGRKKKVAGAPRRRCKREKKVPQVVPKELEEAKKKLDGGIFVKLSSDSSFDESSVAGGVDQDEIVDQDGDVIKENASGSDYNARRKGVETESVVLDSINVARSEEVDERGMVGDTAQGDQQACLEFESLSSSVLSDLQVILNDMNNPADSPTWDSSDPDMTCFLLGLIGDNDERKFSSTFEIAENVRRELVARAESAGTRALSWDITQFDRVGGRGTIRNVWNRLKSDERTGGRKRPNSPLSEEESLEKKKCKISLNISDTCDKISLIELSANSEQSAGVSYLDCSRAENVLSSGENESASRQELLQSVSSVWDLDSSRVENMLSSDEDESASRQEEELLQSVSGAREDNAILNSQSDVSSDNLQVTTESSSMPGLATTESESPEEGSVGSERDSGVSDRQIGNVTNLCRPRKRQHVQTGIVTETGPYIPVTLGFSNQEDDSESWDELIDENGRGTGIEVKSFRLNVVDGRTESIDEELEGILRACGQDDGTNTRWYADSGEPVESGTPELEYQADISRSSSEREECESWERSNDQWSGWEEYEVPVEGNAYNEDCLNVGMLCNQYGGEEEEDEVPVEGNSTERVFEHGNQESVGWRGREEYEVPVEGNAFENYLEDWVVVRTFEGQCDEEEREEEVRGKGESQISSSNGDDSRIWREVIIRWLCVVVVNLLAIWAIVGCQNAVSDSYEMRRVIYDVNRERDVNGAVFGGGSYTASYTVTDARQVATLAEELFELDGDRIEVLAAANRIQNEQERAKLNGSSDDFLE